MKNGPCPDACVLSNEGGDTAKFSFVSTINSSRKEFKCYECGNVAPIGSSYERVRASWYYDETPQTIRTCALCQEIRAHFSCDGGFIFGEVWETLREYLWSELNFSCLDGLSARAKEKVLQDWRAWKWSQL